MVENEMIRGSDWSGGRSNIVASMPDVFATPPRTSDESPKSEKVKVTLRRVPSSSSSTSLSSWNVQMNRDIVDTVEGVPNQKQVNKSMKKLDKVVLNLKKTAGNSWNVSPLSETEGESSSVPAAPTVEKEPQKSQRRGRKSKTAPIKKIHPSKLEEDQPVATAKMTPGEEEDQTVGDIQLPTTPAKQEERAKSAEKTVLADVEYSGIHETSGAKRPLVKAAPLPPTVAKPTPTTKMALSGGKQIRTYARKKRNPNELQSLSNRVAMNTGIPVTISIDLTGDPVGGERAGVGIGAVSTSLDFSSSRSINQSSFDMSEIAEMSQKAMVSQEEQVIIIIIKDLHGGLFYGARYYLQWT
jgi:hypothetical protein